MAQVLFINRLEYWRKKLGFKTKREFAEFLDFAEHQYNPWSLQRAQPNMAQFIYIRNKLRQLKPEITLDDLIYEVPE